MKKFIFILGGARSGKSNYAACLAEKLGGEVAFVATADPFDKEMKERIRLHKASRPKQWKVFEEGKDVSRILSELKGKYEVILIDCLGLMVSNLLSDELKDEEIKETVGKLVDSVRRLGTNAILVSNDVGGGIVPANPLSRRFRDLLGLANQIMAKNADEVIFMQAGIPVTIKGTPLIENR